MCGTLTSDATWPGGRHRQITRPYRCNEERDPGACTRDTFCVLFPPLISPLPFLLAHPRETPPLCFSAFHCNGLTLERSYGVVRYLVMVSSDTLARVTKAFLFLRVQHGKRVVPWKENFSIVADHVASCVHNSYENSSGTRGTKLRTTLPRSETAMRVATTGSFLLFLRNSLAREGRGRTRKKGRGRKRGLNDR